MAQLLGAGAQPPRAQPPGAGLGAESWGWVWLFPGVVLLLVAAACGPGTLWAVEAFGYDVLSYHLQLPREWLTAAGFVNPTHNVYGYLPNLVTSGYLLVGAMLEPWGVGGLGGGRAMYHAAVLHAGFAVLAAWLVGCLGGGLARRLTAGFEGGCVAQGVARGVAWVPWCVSGLTLLVPWVLVTGSLAYDEMTMLAFAAAATALLLEPTGAGAESQSQSAGDPGLARSGEATRRGMIRGVRVGALLGFACLSKLTAGPMLAVPLLAGLAWVWPGDWKRRGSVVGVAVLVFVLTLVPWWVRNGLWTGNPVFPFATSWFGTGHWSAFEAGRWRAAHGLAAGQAAEAGGPGDWVGVLWRQWVGNAGYGALGGAWAGPREATDMARFDAEGGVPVLLITAAAGALAGCLWRGSVAEAGPEAVVAGPRRATTMLVALLGVQVVFWVGFTHQQSRFMIPSLLPLLALTGVGLGGLSVWGAARSPRLGLLVAVALMAAMLIASWQVLTMQTPTVRDAMGRAMHLPVWRCMDAAPRPGRWFADLPGREPLVAPPAINGLSPGSRTLIVADNQALLYTRGHFDYASAFDPQPLTRVIRAAEPTNGRELAAASREAGYTHVLFGWSELRRLAASYGVDRELDVKRLRGWVAGWPVVAGDPRGSALYRVPQVGGD